MAPIPAFSHQPFRRLRGIPESVLRPELAERRPTLPFVTLSRQAGTLSPGFSSLLCQRLSDDDRTPWTLADRSVTERVAGQLRIRPEHVDRPIPWLLEVLDGLRSRPHPPLSANAVHHRVVATIRGVAQEGRALIVGRGGVFITRDLPGGVHLRIVAPDSWRIECLRRQLDLGRSVAAVELKRLDAEQSRFYRNWWADSPDAPQVYTTVLNAAQIDEPQMIDLVARLVAARNAALGNAVRSTAASATA